MWTAFLTGSQAYGGPNHVPNDVDLVVPCSPEVAQKLIELSDYGKLPCKFGNLNLVLVTSPEEYAAWVLSTRECTRQFLVERVPYTKQRAIEIHTQQRMNCGVRPEGNGESGVECEYCGFVDSHSMLCPLNPFNKTEEDPFA